MAAPRDYIGNGTGSAAGLVALAACGCTQRFVFICESRQLPQQSVKEKSAQYNTIQYNTIK